MSDQSPTPTVRRRRLPLSVRIFIGVVALGLAGLGVIYLLGVDATAKWERYAQSLRDAGQPLTYEEIAKRETRNPDGPTAADAVTAMAQRLHEFSTQQSTRSVWIFDRDLPDLDTFAGIPPGTVEPTRSALTRVRGLLGALAAVKYLPAGHVPRRDTADLFEFALPDLSHLRIAANLLRIEAVMALIDEHPDAAVAAIHVQCRLSGTLDEHPTVIARLVQSAMNDTFTATIEDTLRAAVLDDSVIVSLDDDLRDRLGQATMKWALLGERAHWIAVCDRMATGELHYDSTPGVGNEPETSIGLPTCVIRWSQLRGAQLLTGIIDAGEDPAARIAAANKMAREASAAPKTLALLGPLLVDLTNACTVVARRVARLNCARAALAAERFRLATGKFPASLEELVPAYLDAVPTDPFGGKPMVLASTEQGIVIYSIGENEDDDGGDLQRSEGMPRSPDVGFRLVSPERRGIAILDDPPPDGD